MNKICTDISQSKILIELGLDLKTADMDYVPFANDTENYDCVVNMWNNEHEEEWIPAWSLTALLNILPYPSLHSTFMGWRCDSYNKEGTSCIFGEDADNPVDTCYKMIVKLKNMHSL